MDIVITKFDPQLRYVKEFRIFSLLEIRHFDNEGRRAIYVLETAASEIISLKKSAPL